MPAGHNDLRGTVLDASYLGVCTHYIVEARDGARLTVYEQNVERTVHGSLYQPGEAVRLSWSPDHSFVVAGHARAPAGASWSDPARRIAPEALEEYPMNQNDTLSPDRHGGPFLKGTALAGFAAFLAACGPSGLGATAPSAARRRAPRRIGRAGRSEAAGRVRDPLGRAQLRQLAALHRHRRERRDQAQDARGLHGASTARSSTTRRSSTTTTSSSARSGRRSRAARTPAGTSSS